MRFKLNHIITGAQNFAIIIVTESTTFSIIAKSLDCYYNLTIRTISDP